MPIDYASTTLDNDTKKFWAYVISKLDDKLPLTGLAAASRKANEEALMQITSEFADMISKKLKAPFWGNPEQAIKDYNQAIDCLEDPHKSNPDANQLTLLSRIVRYVEHGEYDKAALALERNTDYLTKKLSAVTTSAVAAERKAKYERLHNRVRGVSEKLPSYTLLINDKGAYHIVPKVLKNDLCSMPGMRSDTASFSFTPASVIEATTLMQQYLPQITEADRARYEETPYAIQHTSAFPPTTLIQSSKLPDRNAKPPKPTHADAIKALLATDSTLRQQFSVAIGTHVGGVKMDDGKLYEQLLDSVAQAVDRNFGTIAAAKPAVPSRG